MTTSEDGAGTIPAKRCSLCGAERPLSEFSKDGYRSDGLDYWCKVCKKASAARWKKENPEAHKKSSVKSTAKQNDKTRARRAENNPDGVRAYNLGKWRSENPGAARFREVLKAFGRLETKYSDVPELADVWAQVDAIRRLLALATGIPKEELESGSRWRPRWKPTRSAAAVPPFVPVPKTPRKRTKLID
jgi:hypothetical protein